MAKQPFLVVFKFLALYCALYALFYLARGSSIERMVIDDATVAPAARVIAQLTPDESVRALGNRIVSAHGGLAVQSGCEGVETLFLLLAGVIAFPARLRTKLRGMIYGTALVFVLNQARLAMLFFASRHDSDLFTLLHGYVAPTFIVLAVACYFIWWTGRAGGDTPALAAS